MPYKLVGKCVHKENADGTAGETIKCHETEEMAKRHLRALYANVHESIEGVSELSMYVVKANLKDGEMRLRLTSSDTSKDYYDEEMSEELFDDFIEHIEGNEEIPAPFKSRICEEEWCGGMPYVSIAHYKSGKGRVNVPGEIRSVYRDGRVLKATAVLYDSPLGKAVFKSLQKDLVERREEDKIRISIGFLDLEHSHGDKFTFVRKSLTDKCALCLKKVGDKIYKKGFLVHLAFTRKPANPRTDIEVERSMTTKLEDAQSIIQDEEVEKTLELKSLTEDVLVIKSEEETPVETPVEENTRVSEPLAEEKSVSAVHSQEYMVGESAAQPQVLASSTDPRGYKETEIAPEPTPLEKSLVSLKSQVDATKAQGLTGDEALKAVQSAFEEVGNVLRAEFEPKPTPEQIANQSMEATLRSLLSEMLPQYLAQAVAPIQSEVGELRALSLARPTVQPKQEEVPQPRSLNPTLVQRTAIENIQKKAVSQFDLIARQSVGLQQ